MLSVLYLSTNTFIAACYYTIAFLIFQGLIRRQHLLSNPLVLATIAVFFSGVGHSAHVALAVGGHESASTIFAIQASIDLITVLAAGTLIALRRYYSIFGEDPLLLADTQNQLEQANADLFKVNANLESLVAKRTEELLQTNQKLESEIRERKQAEEETRHLQNFLNSVVENLPIGVFIKEANDLRFLYCNKASEEITGYLKEDVIGKNDYDLFAEKQADLLTAHERTVLGKQKLLDISEQQIQTKHRGLRIFLTRKIPLLDELGRPRYLLGISEDITERKQAIEALRQSEAAQKQLIAFLRQQTTELETAMQKLQNTQSQMVQSEKMSSLGQLVAGVAHEINNPVSFIYGNLTYADQYTQDLLYLLHLYQHYYPQPVPEIQVQQESIDLDFVREDLSKMLSSMKLGADRIRQIVLSLQNFSRSDQAESKQLNIHEGLDSTLLILQHRLKAKLGNPGIELIKEYGDLPLVHCYGGQINQVFMNIIANAIDALEEYSYQNLAIRTIENLQPSFVQGYQKPPIFSTEPPISIKIRTEVLANDGNPRVLIRIRDNGPGIPPEVKPKLFDPFFTTKPVGKGAGLGLSISYQIVVEKHGGVLKCFSEVGEGTEFWIEIPINQSKGR
ncbi:ATP-binding protein [Funiculus sociatus GB2-A5]|uniref:histidine kinase n=1 Tax=Funiculus sociatus GB2-A5 TaxID=2933946 RepID=A0ABV0JKM7_9CYAN|nr:MULTISPECIES: ATP-binding protein [unclassified Trichocoleus]MBD1908461.1 PAS domain-containing protein [Trichocoleus sp. FACHB-832]MBD2061637.1 PAS domain-containing protein [Trichocoleus sp. FACHB-6]